MNVKILIDEFEILILIFKCFIKTSLTIYAMYLYIIAPFGKSNWRSIVLPQPNTGGASATVNLPFLSLPQAIGLEAPPRSFLDQTSLFPFAFSILPSLLSFFRHIPLCLLPRQQFLQVRFGIQVQDSIWVAKFGVGILCAFLGIFIFGYFLCFVVAKFCVNSLTDILCVKYSFEKSVKQHLEQFIRSPKAIAKWSNIYSIHSAIWVETFLKIQNCNQKPIIALLT